MSNKVEVRGIICPSDYDQDFMFPYIQRGIITPESYFRKKLAEADTKKDLTLYINSPGGSVFSGNEMINALLDWKIENKRSINVVIGALAASMGSALLISVADSVKVHSNSKIMFHGAFSGNEGGAESMSDTAELLNKINADIKVKLIRNYRLDPDVVNAWFKEGREGWLTAEEAVTCGMADEIIGEKAEIPESANNIDSMLNERGMKLAALTLKKFKNGDSKMERLVELLKGLFKGKAEEAEIENAFSDFSEPALTEEEADDYFLNEEVSALNEDEEVVEDENEETEEAVEEVVENEEESEELQNNFVPEFASMEILQLRESENELKEQCIAFDDKIKGLNSALNKKQSENDKVKADIVKLTARVEKLLGGGIANFEGEDAQPTDWKSALDACDGDYVEARKTYPEIYAKFMK